MSPRSSEQWDEMREQSRAKILEAALELFGSQGYHATSITRSPSRRASPKA
ncbi:MAG: TetR family transcriptional regulator [Bacteroidetes bacterium]|nr:MAG: TetR family transcriptional regulator [Bacteroidota bacterium]